MSRALLIAFALAITGCASEGIKTVPSSQVGGEERAAFQAALASYSASPRRPADYQRFAANVAPLTNSSDWELRREVELRLSFLPVPQLLSSAASTSELQVTTIWPTGLGIELQPGEGADAYTLRVCALRTDLGCAELDAEARLERLEAVVVETFARRAKGAFDECEACQNDDDYRALLSKLRMRANALRSGQVPLEAPALTN